jgi:hydrogenase maturation protease
MTQVLIAGIGNASLGDDGFGVEVVRRLAGEPLPAGVRLAGFGDRGLHLADELLDGDYERVILVDATPRGGVPGMVYLSRPDPAELGAVRDQTADGHGVTPRALFSLLRSVGACTGRLLVVGCEPQAIEEQAGLTPPVEAAVDEAVELVLAWLAAEGAPIDARQRGALPRG